VNRIASRRRLGLAVVAAVAAPTLLAGCQTNPAAAAVVGSRTVSTDTLSSTVTAALRNPSFNSGVKGDRAVATRDELSRLVTQLLIEEVASAHHVTVTQAQTNLESARLSQQVASQSGTNLQTYYENSGVPADQINGLVRTFAMLGQLSRTLVAGIPVPSTTLRRAYATDIGQFMQVHVAHILVHSKTLAESILARVRSHPSSFAALARRYSIDTGSAKRGGDLGTAAPTSYVAPFAKAAETAPVGSYVLVHSQFGWHVVHVISRRVTETLAQATPTLKAQLLSSRGQALVGAALRSAGRHVHINPRFGSWDNATLQVVAASPTTSKPSPTATPPTVSVGP
jgi:parvulin-like peptidyl-prolyl isomerase